MYTLYTKVSLQPKIRIIIIFNIYTYSSCIQSSRHNFENCLLPCFVPYSYLGHPSSQWRAHAAVRDKIM